MLKKLIKLICLCPVVTPAICVPMISQLESTISYSDNYAISLSEWKAADIGNDDPHYQNLINAGIQSYLYPNGLNGNDTIKLYFKANDPTKSDEITLYSPVLLGDSSNYSTANPAISIAKENFYNLEFLKLPNHLKIVGFGNGLFNINQKTATPNINTITIPSTVRTIGQNAFTFSCANINWIRPDEQQLVYGTSHNGAFNRSNLTEVEVPGNVVFAPIDSSHAAGIFSASHSLAKFHIASETKVNFYSTMFNNCEQLTEVNFPSTLINLYPNVFDGNTKEAFNLIWESPNKPYESFDPILYLSPTTLNIPKGVTAINGIGSGKTMVKTTHLENVILNISDPSELTLSNYGLGLQGWSGNILLPSQTAVEAFENAPTGSGWDLYRTKYVVNPTPAPETLEINDLDGGNTIKAGKNAYASVTFNTSINPSNAYTPDKSEWSFTLPSNLEQYKDYFEIDSSGSLFWNLDKKHLLPDGDYNLTIENRIYTISSGWISAQKEIAININPNNEGSIVLNDLSWTYTILVPIMVGMFAIAIISILIAKKVSRRKIQNEY